MFVRYNTFSLLWALLLLFLTLTPARNMPAFPTWEAFAFDKSAHLFVYAVLVLLTVVGFKKQHAYIRFRLRAVPYALLIAFVYGLVLEVIQSFIPSRHFEWYDLLANTAGCLLGALLFFFIYRW
ncbi:MAG: VanZ family protein [Catalinimonas sp.]